MTTVTGSDWWMMQVPRQECKQVPREVCEQVAKQVCNQVPRENCRDIPREVGRSIVPQKFHPKVRNHGEGPY